MVYPVNIILQNTGEYRYLSARPKDWDAWYHNCDDNSLRQRWYLEQTSVSTPNNYTIKLVGGNPYSTNRKIFIKYDDKNKYHTVIQESDKDPITTFTFEPISGTPYYNIKGNGLYVCSENNNSIYSKARNKSETGGRDKFEVVPVEPFKLLDIRYELTQSDKVIQKPNFVSTTTFTNNTSINQSMAVTFSEKASLTSSFSKTEGISLQVSSSVKISTPFISSDLTMSTTSSKQWTYGSVESNEDSRTYAFNIVAPPYSVLKAKALVRIYDVDATYIARMQGTQSGRIITVTGDWKGITAGEITYEIIESSTGKMLKSFVGTPNSTIDLTK